MMNRTKFPMILTIKVAGLIDAYMKNQDVSLEQAIEIVYHSRLYKVLATEQTKMWHHSPELLLDCLQKELQTGRLELPDE